MGYSQKRVGKNGTRYTAVYFDVRGERRSAGTFAKEREADKAWQAAEARCQEGRGIDPRKGNVHFERYVEDTWFPNHRIELLTRQTYRRRLDKYILPEFTGMRMTEIFPADVRAFLKRLENEGKGPDLLWSIRTILSAIFTTALNDQYIFLHPCKGVKTPVIPEREYTIVSPEQFDKLYKSLPDADAQLLTETAIESGMRWGELTELRVKDLDFAHDLVSVRRTVQDVEARYRVDGRRFVIKDYPKGRKNRRFKISSSLMTKLKTHAETENLSADDLIFRLRQDEAPKPADLPDPDTLGRTAPNAQGRTYKHGTKTAYTLGGCKCEYCRGAFAHYRAERRAAGKDDPRGKREINTDGHIPNTWWRSQVWQPALKKAGLSKKIRFYDLRHSHASWLLAGGADLQVVKERMGHKSIRTTEIYLHTLPEADETALDAFTKIRYRNTDKAG